MPVRDDRTGISLTKDHARRLQDLRRRLERLMDEHVRQGGKLGREGADIAAFRIETLALGDGIENPEEGRRIGAGRIGSLAHAIREVLLEAIESGGSSLRDFRHADGDLGYFQHRFLVYGRDGELCAKPGCDGVIQRIVQSGRSSYWCPRCQR